MGGMAEGASPRPWQAVVVPDDARELEPDRRAWLREQRRARLVERVTRTRSGRQRPVALLLTLTLAVTATLAALLAAVAPRQPATQRPLARTGVPDGRVGGLLPDTVLDTRTGPLRARRLRPAVLVLADGSCDCAPLLERLAQAASTARVAVWVVAPTSGRDAALRLTRDLRYPVRAATDPGDLLRRSLLPRPPAPPAREALPPALTTTPPTTPSVTTPAAPGPVVALVRADGRIEGLLEGADLDPNPDSVAFDIALAALTRPVAASGTAR